MEKILFVIDPVELNMKTVDFACYIANLNKARVLGLFLDYPRHEVEVVADPAVQSTISNYDLDRNDAKMIQKLARVKADEIMERFTNACTSRGVSCATEYYSDLPLVELVAQSRYADLLILDPGLSLQEKLEGIPTTFVKHVLFQSECPVLLAPYDFNGMDEIIIAFDGSASSMYAIKQFTYLFPSLTINRVTMIHVSGDENSTVIDADKINDFCRAHFRDFDIKVLHGNPKDQLFGYMLGKEKAFVVMGAFGRSSVSEFFRRSTAELSMKVVNLPFFIAHQ